MGRVVVIGIDGATFDLIEPWVAEGRLPALARLMDEGSYGRLRVQIPPNTVPNWPSYMTGANPGQHGIVWWLQRDSGWREMSLVNSRTIPLPTIWDLAGQAEKRSIVFNVPVTYPPREIEGVMVTDGILTPPGSNNYTYPSSLAQELTEKIGQYKLWPTKGFSSRNPQGYLDDIHQVLSLRLKALGYLMETYPWDFTSAVLSATDLVSHAYWRYRDPHHPLYDPQEAKTYGSAIRDVYEHVDRGLGRILASLAPDVNVIVMSDHGFGPLYGLSHLNNWLAQEGYIIFKRTPLTRVKRLLHQAGATMENAYHLAMRLGLLGLKHRVDPTIHGRELARLLFLSFDDIDWQRTRAVAFGGMGQIYLTVPGDSPERDTLRNELAEKLEMITLPHGGERYVDQVIPREDIFQGPAVDSLPDLVVLPSTMKYLDAGIEFYTNRLFSNPPEALSGTHRLEGIFIAHGPDFERGIRLKDLSILDLAPTALYLLGLPIPSHVDGRVIEEVVTVAYRNTHPVEIADSKDPESAQVSHPSYTEDQAEQVEQRLKDLGYLS